MDVNCFATKLFIYVQKKPQSTLLSAKFVLFLKSLNFSEPVCHFSIHIHFSTTSCRYLLQPSLPERTPVCESRIIFPNHIAISQSVSIFCFFPLQLWMPAPTIFARAEPSVCRLGAQTFAQSTHARVADAIPDSTAISVSRDHL